MTDGPKEEYKKFQAVQKKLAQDYPFLRNVRCGVWLPPAWYPVFDKLCATIENVLNRWNEDEDSATIEVLQVKSKFGQLRFYYKLTGSKDLKSYVSGLVDMTAVILEDIR